MCAEFVTAYLVAHGDLPPLSGGYRSGYLTLSVSFLSVIIITNLVVDEVVGAALAMWPQGCMAIGRQVGCQSYCLPVILKAMKSDFYIVIQEAIFIPYNLFRLSGRKQHTSVYCQSDLLQEIFLTSRQSCLQSDGKVYNPICKLTSSEAILSAILYTKKQIKFHFVKSKILPIC